ncbi:hypothetical protein [Microbacterium thalassium]|uniref:Uncharacterized protein n=1 Tax=Microbacterium thalassium TaxID=362649 RepID=A0A7X0KVU7_9MICO|nr:hypothetical protein [Microbacterium thalassium]MBB6392610.1 hypothetical protein [Microbacterium thalassium]GLK23159.1 hypothetical protein GCM10017607_04770 [Microbacterium thalassium]
MDPRLDVIVEIFSWVGFGVGALLAGIALVLYVADGTWLPMRVMIEDADDADGGGRVARWFTDRGAVGVAHLTHEQEHALAGQDAADVFVRSGARHRLRLTRHSRVVRGVAYLAAGFIGLGAVSVILSIVLLVARG